MKVGIIRCQQTEDVCQGAMDFKVISKKLGAFVGVEEEIKIFGFVSCGGCPGKRAIARAKKMVENGADTIVFASCIFKGTPNGFACPFANKMKDAVIKAVGESIRILEFTH